MKLPNGMTVDLTKFRCYDVRSNNRRCIKYISSGIFYIDYSNGMWKISDIID